MYTNYVNFVAIICYNKAKIQDVGRMVPNAF